jgi:hypothetical protein
MSARVTPASDTMYEILIRDADGQHLNLESHKDLETARQRLPALAALYPGTRVTLWNRQTRAILEETDGY